MTQQPLQMPNGIIPLLVPNTDVVLIVEKRHITRVGGTSDRPIIFIKGIERGLVIANRQNLPQPKDVADVHNQSAERTPDAPEGAGVHADERSGGTEPERDGAEAP